MKGTLLALSALLALAAAKPCDSDHRSSDHKDLLLSLNKNLLRSVETKDAQKLPNPSVHIALRLSTHHNLAKENEHLNRLKEDFHNDIQNSLRKKELVVGRLALYILALKSSCHDLHSLTLTSSNEKREPLLTHLKWQMKEEKENIASNGHPSTNYYQYSLGILALCVSGVRVEPHVSNKLILAVEDRKMIHGESLCVDSYAMAGMALQCLKDAGTSVQDADKLDQALTDIKQTLLNSKRNNDGHMGNEFSTGLAVQALLAMGSQVEECDTAMEALRADARKGTYHNPMAISQTLPALQQRSYLSLKSKECRSEDDTLTSDAEPDPEVPPSEEVTVQVEVIKSNGRASEYSVSVPKGSSLLNTLTHLQDNHRGFTFKTEDSLWGPFLSVINNEQARQKDRRYWHVSSNDAPLTEGIKDYKIQSAQKITIKNTAY